MTEYFDRLRGITFSRRSERKSEQTISAAPSGAPDFEEIEQIETVREPAKQTILETPRQPVARRREPQQVAMKTQPPAPTPKPDLVSPRSIEPEKAPLPATQLVIESPQVIERIAEKIQELPPREPAPQTIPRQQAPKEPLPPSPQNPPQKRQTAERSTVWETVEKIERWMTAPAKPVTTSVQEKIEQLTTQEVTLLERPQPAPRQQAKSIEVSIGSVEVVLEAPEAAPAESRPARLEKTAPRSAPRSDPRGETGSGSRLSRRGVRGA